MRKATMGFVMSVRPSAWNCWAPTGRIFVKFGIGLFFQNLSRNFTVSPCILIHWISHTNWCTFICNKIFVSNVHIKTLKNAPTCFDLIQIIFRELMCSLLKLLILKFLKNVKVNMVMRQHNIWCMCVRSVWRCVQSGLQSSTHLHTEEVFFNLLKPNDTYICRTAALTSRCYILNIYSTNIHTEYFKHAA